MIPYSLIKVIHIMTAILMAWPFYALVKVNQRARLGPPLGGRVDVYMESIIKNRTIPCFAFQGTALVSGLAMVLYAGQGPSPLILNPVLGLNFVLLFLVSSSLSYVHFRLQPQIDSALARPDSPLPPEVASRVGGLRLNRKRLALM